jgi:hypothetical protein
VNLKNYCELCKNISWTLWTLLRQEKLSQTLGKIIMNLAKNYHKLYEHYHLMKKNLFMKFVITKFVITKFVVAMFVIMNFWNKKI